MAGDDRPEKTDHPQDKTAHRLNTDLFTFGQVDLSKEVMVRLCQAALWNQNQ